MLNWNYELKGPEVKNSVPPLPNPAFMPSTLVGQQDGQAASPTPAPSSAPRTETMTAAPASAPSSQLEVHNIPLASAPHSHLNPSLLTTNLVKHCYPPPCKCPEVHFIPTPANIKLLLTYSCAFGCSISWPEIQFSHFFFLSLNTNSLTYLFCRLVVWSLRSLQSEWHILPKLIQCGPLQWHKVVLLEGSKYDGYNDNHDGAPGKLLMAWCPPQMKNTLDIVDAGKEFKSDCWWSQAPNKLEWRFSSCLWTCAHSEKMTVVSMDCWGKSPLMVSTNKDTSALTRDCSDKEESWRKTIYHIKLCTHMYTMLLILNSL